jgi:hypothetical protein
MEIIEEARQNFLRKKFLLITAFSYLETGVLLKAANVSQTWRDILEDNVLQAIIKDPANPIVREIRLEIRRMPTPRLVMLRLIDAYHVAVDYKK